MTKSDSDARHADFPPSELKLPSAVNFIVEDRVLRDWERLCIRAVAMELNLPTFVTCISQSRRTSLASKLYQKLLFSRSQTNDISQLTHSDNFDSGRTVDVFLSEPRCRDDGHVSLCFLLDGIPYSRSSVPFLPSLRSMASSCTFELVLMQPSGVAILVASARLKVPLSHRKLVASLARIGPRLLLEGLERSQGASHRPGQSVGPIGVLHPTKEIDIVFIINQFRRAFLKLWRRYFTYETWTIGLVGQNIDDLIATGRLSEPKWLEPPTDRIYIADPFLFCWCDETVLMYEAFDLDKGMGHIESAVGNLGSIRLRDSTRVMESNVHMSYPSWFRYAGETYCVPEMNARPGLHYFKMGELPTIWSLSQVQLNDLHIVDPTLVEAFGRWWLFASLRGDTEDQELHCWHSDSPFGPWRRHALSPLKMDVMSARPAGGIFFHKGALYRPAQDCSGSYGAAVVLNKITKLDPDRFDEEQVLHLRPSRHWRFNAGLHTFQLFGSHIVIDAKTRHIRVWPVGRRQRRQNAKGFKQSR